MNKLSIITINYNSAKLVEELVVSIQKSKVSFGIKIIVVENSQEDLSGLLGITYLKNSGNNGFSQGNNLGITKSEGEYVWFMNPDTTVDPNTIAFMIEYMDKHPEVGIATPKVILQSGKLDKNCRRSFPTPANSLKRFLGLKGYFVDTPENKETEVDAVMGSSLLVCKSLGDKIGWWDEDYFMYGEDLEFCWQIKKLGYKIMYVPDVIVHHHHGASSGLKKTSQAVTKANSEIRRRATKASINAMRIFYQKHYAKNKLVDGVVYLGIWLLEQIRLIKL